VSRAGVVSVRLSDCESCRGEGAVRHPVMVGRKGRRRQVAEQGAMCLACGGSGVAAGCGRAARLTCFA
jgi:DnaJ-class molecular chaperone